MAPLIFAARSIGEFCERCSPRSRRVGGPQDFAGRMRIFATAVVGLLGATAGAHGADLSPPPPLASPFYSWTGLYIGLNAGYGSAKVGETVTGPAPVVATATPGVPGGIGTASASIPGGIGGAQIGYNYQFGRFVLGFEADFDGTMATKSLTSPVLSGTAQIPWVGTYRGRFGFAFDRYLVYATVGGAATQLFANNVSVLFTPPPTVGTASTTYTHGAWTVGGGIEFGINDYVTAKMEYLYLDTGNINVAQISAAAATPLATINGRIQESMVRAGLNLRLPAEP